MALRRVSFVTALSGVGWELVPSLDDAGRLIGQGVYVDGAPVGSLLYSGRLWWARPGRRSRGYLSEGFASDRAALRALASARGLSWPP